MQAWSSAAQCGKARVRCNYMDVAIRVEPMPEDTPIRVELSNHVSGGRMDTWHKFGTLCHELELKDLFVSRFAQWAQVCSHTPQLAPAATATLAPSSARHASEE